MWTRTDLKMNAKIAFQRNYWTCVAVSLLVGVLAGGTGSAGTGNTVSTVNNVQYNNPASYNTYSAYSYNSKGVELGGWGGLIAALSIGMILLIGVIALLYGILVGNVIRVGGNRYYMENREHKTKASQIFYGFQKGRYGHVVWTMLCSNIFIFLWSLLLIVPGIIKSYSYRLVPYILAENPHMDRKRVLELSEEMMNGYKMEAFVLELSFIGWILLSALTCGILNMFYVSPYMDATYAEFYAAVKSDAIGKGLVAEGELPGFQTEAIYG